MAPLLLTGPVNVAVVNIPHDPVCILDRTGTPFYPGIGEWECLDSNNMQALPVALVIGPAETERPIWVGSLARGDPVWEELRTSPIAAEYGRRPQ